jgi:hypothetical protein
MKGQQDFLKVGGLIAQWKSNITFQNDTGLLDINKLAEVFVMKLLNEIYGYKLEDLNDAQKDFPGIDLGDIENKIAFQVTSRSDPDKIRDSLKKFNRYSASKYTNGIRFFILKDEKKNFKKKTTESFTHIYHDFDPDKHILTVKNLEEEIGKIFRNDKDRGKFYRIKRILEEDTGKIEHGKGEFYVQKVEEISKPNLKFILLLAIFGTLSEIAFITFTMADSAVFPMEIHEWLLLITSFAIEYIVYSKCLQNIVEKLKMPDSFIAWIPVLNILLMLRIANINLRIKFSLKILIIIIFLFILFSALVIFIFIPITPMLIILFFMNVWSKVALKLHISREVGLLAGFPIIGKFAAIYLVSHHVSIGE